MTMSMEEFAAKVRADKALALRVFAAEANAASAMATLREIAASEGVALSTDPPALAVPTPTDAELADDESIWDFCWVHTCWFTCCLYNTSVAAMSETKVVGDEAAP